MAATKAAPKKRSQFEEVWRRLKKNKMAMIGLAIVVFLVLLAVFADFLFDYEQVVIKQNTAIRLLFFLTIHRLHLINALLL